MNGRAREDLEEILLDDNSSGGGGDISNPGADAFSPMLDDTGPNSGTPSPSAVFNIDNMSGSDDEGSVAAHKPSSPAGAEAACCGGLAARKPLSAASGLGGLVSHEVSHGVSRNSSSLIAARLGGGAAGSHVRMLPRRASAAARGVSGGAFAPSGGRSPCSSMLSGDDTDKHSAHSSDGNVFNANGSMGSVIGSIDGESPHDMSDSSYHGSAFSTSTGDSDDSSYSPSSGSESGVDGMVNETIVSCRGEDDEAPSLERPIGMMLAKENPDNPGADFVCSKIRQKYEKSVDNELREVFEVVFRDGEKAEYSRDEVLLYSNNYKENEGSKGCVDFFFKV